MSTPAPKIMKAVKTQPGNKVAVESSVSVPKLRKGQVLVKTVAVGQNPSDWKHVFRPIGGGPGSSLGSDFSGIIHSIPPDSTTRFVPGDRVSGFIHGCAAYDSSSGAYAEYIAAEEDLLVKVPDEMDLVAAASFGVAGVTTAMSLYQSLGIPMPGDEDRKGVEKGTPILIYGGATSVSQLAIQFAHLSGLTVIATASLKNHALLKSLGADYVFEYKDADECIRNIREASKGQLTLAHDGIAEGESIRIVMESFGPEGGKASFVIPIKPENDVHKRPNVQLHFPLGYVAVGREFKLGSNFYPAEPETRKFCKDFFETAEKMLAEGKLRFQGIRKMPGGLDGVEAGLKEMQVKGGGPEKWVYVVDEKY